MSIIFCQYLKKNETALEQPPFLGELGLYIQKNISAQAWDLWRTEQVKLINEKRLSLGKPTDRLYLKQQLCAFFQIDSTGC